MNAIDNIQGTIGRLLTMGLHRNVLHIVMTAETERKIAEAVEVGTRQGPPSIPEFLGCPHSTVMHQEEIYLRASVIERDLLRTVICVREDGSCGVLFQSTFRKTYEEVEQMKETISAEQSNSPIDSLRAENAELREALNVVVGIVERADSWSDELEEIQGVLGDLVQPDKRIATGIS